MIYFIIEDYFFLIYIFFIILFFYSTFLFLLVKKNPKVHNPEKIIPIIIAIFSTNLISIPLKNLTNPSGAAIIYEVTTTVINIAGTKATQ